MARPRLVSDEQILGSLRRRVLTEGPGVSLDVVASDLGVTTPALLRRFGSRQALMIAALKPPPRPAWIEELRKGPDERDLEEQLRDVFTPIAAFLADVIPCMSALRESGIPFDRVYEKPKAPEEGLKALQRWLTLARERGLVGPTELDTAAFAMLGALQTRAFFAHIMQRPYSARAQREYVAELARLFARALRPAPCPPGETSRRR